MSGWEDEDVPSDRHLNAVAMALFDLQHGPAARFDARSKFLVCSPLRQAVALATYRRRWGGLAL